ncbi:RidA family protein [Pseudoroseomonas globiformis]|uniref:RidA family protein n=1 Tax=Teichococcus globiformis TaxID=2307229 RepID=A0ABV7G717_9PROT
MDKPEFFVTGGFGQRFREALHFSTAVKIGNRVETSGQGGWDDDLNIPEAIEDEITAAFRNIGLVLADAGAAWDHVVHVNTYHVGGFPPIVNQTILAMFRRSMPNHAPIWTQLGVEALGLPAMRFEMRVTAVIA